MYAFGTAILIFETPGSGHFRRSQFFAARRMKNIETTVLSLESKNLLRPMVDRDPGLWSQIVHRRFRPSIIPPPPPRLSLKALMNLIHHYVHTTSYNPFYIPQRTSTPFLANKYLSICRDFEQGPSCSWGPIFSIPYSEVDGTIYALTAPVKRDLHQPTPAVAVGEPSTEPRDGQEKNVQTLRKMLIRLEVAFSGRVNG